MKQPNTSHMPHSVPTGPARLSNFVVIESVYGKFIVNRYCHFQAEALIKTGRTHIENELTTIFQLMDRLPEGAIVVDGGTNIGFFSIPVAQRYKHRSMRIIGFEPQRPIYYAIAGALALNDLSNCFVYNLGLSDHSGKAMLPIVNYAKNFDFGTVSIQDTSETPPNNYLDDTTVAITTIDALQLPRLDFIKLDVEGHECQALRGGMQTIRTFRPLVWAEYFLIGREKIEACFAELEGYAFYVMDRQNMLCAPAEKLAAMGITIQPNP